MSNQATRRKFLQRTQEAAAVTAAVSTLGGVHAWAAPAPSTLHVGIIGCGGIMRQHVGRLSQRPDVSIAWLCDVDPRQVEKMSAIVGDTQPAPPKHSGRHEDVVADPDVDAVVIATPHHWHAPIAVEAMAEGKDVYVEKPLSHVYAEGPAMIAAATKYDRVVQHGSQMRSSAVTLKAEKLLREGIIGEVHVAKAWTAEHRTLVKSVPDSQPPDGVDYDRWLGPAPRRAFNQRRFHTTWRLFHEYGNGEIGDDGIHDIDMACWGLGVDALPRRVTARGSRMLLHEQYGDYPDNLIASFEFPDGKLLLYENYPFTHYGIHGFDNGNVFYGSDGYMVFSRRGAFTCYLGPKRERGPTEGRDIRGQRGYDEHMTDFLDAVRDHNRDTRARPEIAHLSCALVHFGNIANLTTGRLDFDAARQQFVECEEANRLLTKSYREPYRMPDVTTDI